MIYEGDFFKGLEEHSFFNSTVSLVVTSPPYLSARKYGNSDSFHDPDEWGEWCKQGIVLLSKSLKDGGVIWWNVAPIYRENRMISSTFRMIVELESYGIYLVEEIPWVKQAFRPARPRNRPIPAWEHNFIFTNNPDKVVFYADNVRQPYKASTLDRFTRYTRPLSHDNGDFNGPALKKQPHPGGALPPNYLSLPQDYTKRPHPATMSPFLANWAIRAYSTESDLVLDPMSGVGTTWVESIKLGRNFVGFEMHSEYIQIANKSIELLNQGLDPYYKLKEIFS